MAQTDRGTRPQTYDAGWDDEGDVRVSPRTHSSAPGRSKPRAKKVDPSAPSIDRPAHPLPSVRSGQLNYDQYLQRATDKFQIFSAAERRARRKRVIFACAAVVICALVIIWVAVSRMR